MALSTLELQRILVSLADTFGPAQAVVAVNTSWGVPGTLTTLAVLHGDDVWLTDACAVHRYLTATGARLDEGTCGVLCAERGVELDRSNPTQGPWVIRRLERRESVSLAAAEFASACSGLVMAARAQTLDRPGTEVPLVAPAAGHEGEANGRH